VQVESLTGMIQLPIEHLFDHPGAGATRAPAASLAVRMKESLSVASKLAVDAGVAASKAGKAAAVKAGEVAGQVGSKVNERVKTYRAQPATEVTSPTIRVGVHCEELEEGVHGP